MRRGDSSITINAFVDVKSLAAIIRLLKQKGILRGAPGYSAVIRKLVDIFNEQLKPEQFQTVEEAIEWLAREHYSLSQLDGRGPMANALSEESIKLEQHTERKLLGGDELDRMIERETKAAAEAQKEEKQ